MVHDDGENAVQGTLEVSHTDHRNGQGVFSSTVSKASEIKM